MKKFFIRTLLTLILMAILVPTALSASAHLINLDFKNADVRDVLRALASQEGVNIYIDGEVSGTVTISLSRVTFKDALNIITQNNQLIFSLQDKVYYIKPLDQASLKIDFKDGNIEIEAVKYKQASLWEEVARKSGLSLVPSPDLEEKISITLPPTPIEDAINALLAQTNCFTEKAGTVRLIKKKSTPQFPFSIVYQNGLLTIDAKNVPVPILCRAITEKANISVVPDPNVTQSITVYLQNLNLTDTLNLLCATNGLLLYREGEAWRISRSTGAFRVLSKDHLLSIDADNVDISALSKEIARQTGINLILDKEVKGNVTTHFKDLPFDQGLSVILENQGWILEKQDTYFYIRVNPNQNKNCRIVYDSVNNLFDLDIQTAPIGVIINEMARRANLNVVILSQVNWTVNNLRLQKLGFTEVMDFLFKGTVYTYTLINDIYLIGDGLTIRPENRDFGVIKIYPIKYIKADQLLNTLPSVFPRQNFVQLSEKNALIVSAPPQIHTLFEAYLEQVDTASIEDRTEVIKINYLKAEDVLKLIPSSISKNDLTVIKEANSIAVTGPQNLINQVKSYINKIDQVNPLIVFDILVLQITGSNGLTWDGPKGSLNLGNGKELYFNMSKDGITFQNTQSDNTTNIASLLAETEHAKILANPTITTLNGYPASFNVSTKRSYTIATSEDTSGTDKETTYTVKTYDSGLYITITPWVSASDQITMEIKPKISEFGAAPEGSKLPTTTERSTETTVRVKAGETTIISGLKNTRTEEFATKVPWLGDIPLLGNLFKSTSRTISEDEFIIIITPRLIYDHPMEPLDNQVSKYSTDLQESVLPEKETAEKK